MKDIWTSYNSRLEALLKNVDSIQEIGLMNGKMGVSIILFLISRSTANTSYNKYAENLIDVIYESLSLDRGYDLANGIAGIGWGIEFLVQNRFVDADTDEILEEFDSLLMPLVYYFPSSNSLCKGLIGVGHYYLKRIENIKKSNDRIHELRNKQLLIHLISELDRRTMDIPAIIKEPTAKVENIDSRGKSYKMKSITVFDMSWDFTALLSFLLLLLPHNLYNTKITSMMYRLIGSLGKSENHPKLKSNRLLLALALLKIRSVESGIFEKYAIGSLPFENDFFELITEISSKLLSEITRVDIQNELIPGNISLKNGVLGISLLYQKVFKLTMDEKHLIEADYWFTQSITMKLDDNVSPLNKDVHLFNNPKFGLPWICYALLKELDLNLTVV